MSERSFGASGSMSPASAAAPLEPAFEIESKAHLLDRLAVVARYRHVAVSVFLLTALAMYIQGYTKVPQYLAEARLLIENERAATIPGLTSAPDAFYEEDIEPYYQTQYKMLKGRDLARRIVQQLKLESNPEFNGAAPRASLPILLVHSLEKRVGSLFAKEETVRPSDVSDTSPAPDESALVNAFLDRVTVEPVRGSRLVDVYFVSTDAAFAAQAVNALVDEYVEQNLTMKLQSTEHMLGWLDKEVASQQKKVEDSERELAEYRERQNALSLDDKNNLVAARLNHINDELMKVKAARIQKQAVFDQIKSIAAGSASDSIPAIAQNPQVQAFKAKLVELQREKTRLSEKYEYKHPAVVAINNQIQDAQHQLDLETIKALQAIKNEYETAALEEQVVSRSLEAAKADAVDLTRKSINYNVMEREAKSNRQLYEALLQREKELHVSNNSRSNNVRVIDRAEIPKAPLAPASRSTWFKIVVIAVSLSLGVVFGLDYMNDTIKTPEDVTHRLKLPFLGLVPAVSAKPSLSVLRHHERPSLRVRWTSRVQYPLLTSSREADGFGEAFRNVRAALVSKYPRKGTKTVLVTSAEPLEGKTTAAANISLALALGGARVLLIDADMRRPGVHRAMRLVNDRGLSQILVGRARVGDVVQRAATSNLFVIASGPPPPNPSELLSSERMKALLSVTAQMSLDWVIIDTPPVLVVADAVILAPEASGVTLVISAERTRRRLAERTVETIVAAGSHHTSVVLNKVNFKRNKYYYSRYYGYRHKNYYAEGT